MTLTRSLRYVLLSAGLLMVPSVALAQSVAGIVRDASGGVLPGVAVEAASPVLIEKTRTAVTDSTGQYRITDLPPGTYSITFTLASFATVKRENLELSGGAVVPVNVEMRVGNLQETITVSSEAPVVDVQTSTKKQTVLSNAVLETLPSSRGYGNLISSVPGIQQTQVDNGTNPRMTFFTAHGGRGNEGTVQVDSMNVGAAFNGGGVSEFGYPIQTASEVQVTVVGGLGETDRGGPAFNIIPKTGGNKFSGQGFLSSAGNWAQGSNLDDSLRAFGITDVPKLINNWDASFSMGGPIIKDRLWFYGSVRTVGTVRDIPGFYGNKNAGNPNAWSYVADPNLQERDASSKNIGAIRLTSQASQRNKFTFYYDYQRPCAGSSYSADGQQCRNPGDGWTALNGGFNSGAPRIRQRLGRPREDRPGILVVAGHLQAAARGRRLGALQQLGRTAAGRRADEFHPGRRARSERRRAGSAVCVSRALELLRQSLRPRSDPRGLASIGDLRDRRAQPQDRIPGRPPEGSPDAHGGRLGHQLLPVLRRIPHPVDAADDEPAVEQPDPVRRLLRAGPVDEGTRDPAGRAALRARLELVPRRGKRHPRHVAVQLGADCLPGNPGRARVQRHHAAHGPRLRRVREREDRVQGELQQVSPAGQQRERLHLGQPGGVLRQHDRSFVVRSERQQSRRLRPEQLRRRTANAARGPTRTSASRRAVRPSTLPCSADGARGRTTGSCRSASSTRSCRASRPKSATTAARGATSTTSTTGRSRRPTTTRSRWPRRRTTSCRTAAATRTRST